MRTKIFPATLDALDDALEFVEASLRETNCDAKSVMQIKLALEEVFVNVVHYGYRSAQNGTIEISMEIDTNCLLLRLSDAGAPFNPLEHNDPDVSVSAQARNIGGLGIFLVKKLMDSVGYEYKDKHNVLTLVKKWS